MLIKFSFILIAICLFSTTAFAESILRVAVEDNYPPYSFMNESGEMAGFNVDISHALAQLIGVECKIFSVAWDDMLPRLVADDYDVIIACMAIKPEREKVADFTDYYLRSKTGFIGQKGMSNDTSPAGVTGKTLVSQEDTAQLAYIQKTYGDIATVKGYPSMQEGFIAVAEKRADLCLTPLLAGLEFLKSDKGQHCDIIGPALTENQFVYSPAHIAVRKGNDSLRRKLNDALRGIRANGAYSIISRKYFPFSVY